MDDIQVVEPVVVEGVQVVEPVVVDGVQVVDGVLVETGIVLPSCHSVQEYILEM